MNLTSENKPVEPEWISEVDFDATQVDLLVLEWLMKTASLTQRMRDQFGAEFRVCLLRQEWGQPYPSESKFVEKEVMVREVFLMGNEKPCVYARSLFPKKWLEGEGKELQALGEVPLGDFFAKQRHLSRSAFEFAKVFPLCDDYKNALNKSSETPEFLWARRSIFYCGEEHLFVSEYFLPYVFTV